MVPVVCLLLGCLSLGCLLLGCLLGFVGSALKVLPSSLCPEVVVVPGGGDIKSPHHLRQDRRSLFGQFPGKFF